MINTLLLENKEYIRNYVSISDSKYNILVTKISQQLIAPIESYYDEEVWTFLITCGYAICGKLGIKKMARLLSKDRDVDCNMIFLEVQPISPKKKGVEGNTSLDLALGSIQLRKGTVGGIELLKQRNTFINFCEAKWYSDISKSTKYDQQRNQLARIIDNALSFQKDGDYSDKAMVTLITPFKFKNLNNKSRLYQYKYEEYINDFKKIAIDIDNSKLDIRSDKGWVYPDSIKDRLDSLELNWVSYEELFKNIPNSILKKSLLEFEILYNKSQLMY